MAELDPLSDHSVELSSNRTAMSLERTILSQDRTLLSVLRTSLSLISFGFTIYQFLGRLAQTETRNAVTAGSARNFGATLIILGIILLVAGLWSHFRALADLRTRRRQLHGEGLLRSPAIYRPTTAGVVAFVLLVLGIVSVSDMLLRTGPLR
jgi:putative membrane protein